MCHLQAGCPTHTRRKTHGRKSNHSGNTHRKATWHPFSASFCTVKPQQDHKAVLLRLIPHPLALHIQSGSNLQQPSPLLHKLCQRFPSRYICCSDLFDPVLPVIISIIDTNGLHSNLSSRFDCSQRILKNPCLFRVTT